MILLLDTSSPTCKLTLLDGENRVYNEWEAHRELAHNLLRYLREQLESQDKTLHDISAIGAFQGPGSFTGLRIGLTVLNTLAAELSVPIVGAQGEAWEDDAIRRLQLGENDKIVMPFYGREANITTPRK
ncbi:MAG TPA: tRNA (adenosine(37)-N6)-threonylcarbamoyltransferase complex dimerization subunit type 1 TsaB [Candidatus Saccharibacteria bacterium]|nr:tRNA (adenosine(37)-N6)-threonylcarbamoyltransferase complex dimerization subunit type 1 TsaB [Candidatus Saccharibacteria bacterium]